MRYEHKPPSERTLLEELWEDGALPLAIAWIVGIAGVIIAGGFAIIIVIVAGKMFGAW